MDKQDSSKSSPLPVLPIALGIVGGLVTAVVLLFLVYLLRKKYRAKRTLKWQELGVDYSQVQNTKRRKPRGLQRQKTIEFELPVAPKLVTTQLQVNHDSYDATGCTPTGHFLAPQVVSERRGSAASVDSSGSGSSSAGGRRASMRRQKATLGQDSEALQPPQPATPELLRRQYLRRGSFSRSPSVTMEEVEISLYTTGGSADDELSGVASVRSRGRLHFSLCHDTRNSCLIVNVHKAIALKPVRAGKVVPRMFVGVTLWPVTDRKQRFATAVAKASADPQFDESFCFILEEGRYSHQEVYAKFSLQTADGRQQQSTTTTMGTVLFDLKLLETLDIPGTALDVWRDVLPEDVVPKPRGEINICLCYEKARQRLRTRVISVRNIDVYDQVKFEVSDLTVLSAYVKVLLISDDQVQKRRRSGLQKCSDVSDFIFNEEYIFQISATDTLDEVTLTFTVTCRDAQGHSLTLGKVNVGSLSYAEGPGLAAWQKIQDCPGEWMSQSLGLT